MSFGPKQTLEEGFEKFVVKNSTGCWDWKGCCPKNPGYGQFRSGGKIYKAHRSSWIIHKGAIPKGAFVCHTCDNRRCSNPDHLFLGTCKENNLDAIRKKIHPTMGRKRDENHMTKIFTKDVPEILRLYDQGYSQTKIAEILNVSQSSISQVIRESQGVGY